MRKGVEGELLARDYLAGHGMSILETNYRFHHGEIDIIGRDGDTLVFCEVKTRSTDTFGPPEAAITPSKQRQIRKLAEAYLVGNRLRDQVCRFDVVAIDWTGTLPQLRHIRNAF
jgi:putative endonuclease